jgi:hypothetical protein
MRKLNLQRKEVAEWLSAVLLVILGLAIWRYASSSALAQERLHDPRPMDEGGGSCN